MLNLFLLKSRKLHACYFKLNSIRFGPPHLTQSLFDGLFGEGRIRFFSNQSLAAFATTCSDFHAKLAPVLTQRKLIQHVVHGEQNEAEAMIKANPILLLIQTQAIDYSGRTIIGTPFQAALGAEDERMWAMMKPYFKQLESTIEGFSAQEEMEKQFNGQFPEGISDASASQLQPFYNELATAISNSEDSGDAAIEAFRNKITERKKVTSGKHFNMQHLIAAYLAYIDNFDTLATWDNRDKFWQKVIGYVQRQMPANYAQTHCSDIQSVLDDPNQFKRTFDLEGGRKFFPLATSVGLGFDFGVYSFFGQSGGRFLFNSLAEAVRSFMCGQPRHAADVIKLCRAKTESLVSFKRELNLESQESPSFVIA